MARSNSYNSASSQFFICNDSNQSVSNLDGDYAAFGWVIEGMDVVDTIATTKTDWYDRPYETQKMKKMKGGSIVTPALCIRALKKLCFGGNGGRLALSHC